MPKTLDIQNAPVFSYRIASADMRYVEIGIREIYLRKDPNLGQVFQGEIPNCGRDCYVGLNEILLEYAVSWEGCREQSVVSDEVVWFGERLGGILVENIYQDITGLPASEKLSTAFKSILNSTSSPYHEECKEDHLEYTLDCCPLSECARRTGLRCSMEMAYVSFTVLYKSLIKALAPNWVLMQPSEEDIDLPLHTIVAASL